MATAVAPHIYHLLLLYFLHISLSQQAAASQECHCTSGCDVNFRCTGGCLQGWSGPTCQIRNIALNKSTQQSSTLNDCKWASTAAKRDVCGDKTSSLAVDGVTSSRYWSGTCTHTAPGRTSAWWRVDLGETHLITNLTIFFSNRQKMRGFLVRVDGHPCYQRDRSSLLRSPVSFSCDTPTSGQRVTVRLPTLTDSEYILNLCEVEIYECADGSFGPGCSSWCLCKNTSEVCDKDTGHCESGCADGHTGADCQEPCPPGRYGQGCKETCGHCDGGDRNCDEVDGTCTFGCQDKWSGTLCKECSDFWFGGRCDRGCKCKETYQVCDKKTGQCDSGCEDGWTGLDCQTLCEAGSYGLKCEGRCGHCEGGHTNCSPHNGSCHLGCEGNWRGRHCGECKDRFYGAQCSSRCGRCRSNATCSTMSGDCPDGCEPGWQGMTCDQECDEGRYGAGCSETCGQCAGKCSPADGSCDREGCGDWWTGKRCDVGPACPVGRNSQGCKETCGHCDGGDQNCNEVDGRCTRGCQDNWSGRLCKALVYGTEKTHSCPCMNCSPNNGSCHLACEFNWRGRRCGGIRNTDSKLIIPVVGSCVAIIIIIIVGNVAVTMYILRRRKVRQGETTAHHLEFVNLGRQEEGEDVDSTPQIYQNTTTSTGIYEDLGLTPDHVYEELFGAFETPMGNAGGTPAPSITSCTLI